MFKRPDDPARVAVALGASTCLVAAVVAATVAFNSSASAEPGSMCGSTAAAALGWGDSNRVDDFTDPSSLDAWDRYDGVGHAGNGVRTPSAISVDDGQVTIKGDAEGNSGGMAWNPGQMYGRWEVCAKSSVASPNYHSVALLWPDAEDWPAGGEADFMEITDPARQTVEGWLHHGPEGSKETSSVQIDATQWHSWAVEWTPKHVAYYVDGRMWWETTDPSHLPPRPMHLCLQVDNFGGDVSQGGQLSVDWARQYPV